MEHASFILIDVGEKAEAPTSSLRASCDADPRAWALQQAALIRLGRFHDVDVEKVADEVEDLARRERRELVNRHGLVFQHLLKWDSQPERRSASWARTVREQRTQVDEILGESRSLRPGFDRFTAAAFRQGRVAALNETGLSDDAIPEANPHTWDEAMTRPVFWPEP